MAVYFVYRCHAGAPNEKFVRRFEYDTVLAWAKAVFQLHPTRDEAKRYADALFGFDAEPLHGLFRRYEQPDENPLLRPPRSMADVERWFSAIYCEEEKHGPHYIQCLTEWADNQRAVYVFDDHYIAKKPGKADFLLLGGWELPAGESDAAPPKLPRTIASGPSGDGEGRLYFASTFVDCKYNLEDLDPQHHIDGARVPDLARHLLLCPDPDTLDFPLNRIHSGLLDVLREPTGEDAGFLTAIRDQPSEQTNWAAYSDWLADRDRPPAGLHLLDRALRADASAPPGQSRHPSLDLVKVSGHAAQVCKHDGRYPDAAGDGITSDDWFEQYFLFDDRWAAAHPVLAAGVLNFASRWDVLSVGPRTAD